MRGVLLGLALISVTFGWAGGQEPKKPADNPPMFMRKFEGHGEMPAVKDYRRKPNDIVTAYRKENAFTTLSLYDKVYSKDSLSEADLVDRISSKDILEIAPLDQVRIIELLGSRPNYDEKYPNDCMLVEIKSGKQQGRYLIVSCIGFVRIHPSYEKAFAERFNRPKP